MKNLILSLITIIIAISLVGCTAPNKKPLPNVPNVQRGTIGPGGPGLPSKAPNKTAKPINR